MKPNLADFPDSEDEKYWYENIEWVNTFDYDKFEDDVQKWREGFEASLRSRCERCPYINIEVIMCKPQCKQMLTPKEVYVSK